MSINMIRKALYIGLLLLNALSGMLQAQDPYCVPSLSSGCASDYIASVQFAGLANPGSNCNGNSNSYVNYDVAQYTAQVYQGQEVGFVVATGLLFSQYIGLWIDYNNDGDFEDANEFVASSAGRVFALAGTLVVPDEAAVNGLRRLRVRCNWDAPFDPLSACTAAIYGETEDYTISITAMAMFSGGTNDGYFLYATSHQTSVVPNLGGSTGDGYALQNGQHNTTLLPSFDGGMGDGYSLGSGAYSSGLVANYYGSSGDGFAMASHTLITALLPNLNGGLADGYQMAEHAYQTLLQPTFTGGLGDGYSNSSFAFVTNLLANANGGIADGYGIDSASATLEVVCIPLASAGCSAYGGDYIDQVVLNTLDNSSSGCNGNPNGYIRYQPAEYTTSLTQGQAYTLHLQTGAANSEYLAVWVDWNNDHDFDDADELMARTLTKVSSLDVDFVVPLTQVFEGQRRMRVRCAYMGSFAPLGSCASVQWGETEDYFINIQTPANKLLEVQVVLEGMATGPGLMNKAQDLGGDRYQADTVDLVNLVLHQANPPYAALATFANLALHQNGTVQCALPGYNNASYYINVSSRNHLAIWSASPVSFAGSTITYNFSDAANKAYGNRLKDLGEGIFGLYAGDVDANGLINLADVDSAADSAIAFAMGYIPTDVNGDGAVDALDLILIDNNAATALSVAHP